jgi:MFS family permease
VLGAAYKRYVLFVLTLIYTFNLLDRAVFNLLLQPIKEDFHLSDTQLGFTNIAFGIFYATLGLPIARWADRGNRVRIAAGAIALWGVTVMACVFVMNFAQLMLARIAAAVGESGGQPPTYSLLGDYFPGSAERSRAMAVYWLATPISALVGFIVGGWLNERFGWRMTFFIMGAPALLVGALVRFTVREPRERLQAAKGAAAGRPPSAALAPSPLSMWEVLKILWQQQSARHLIIGIVLLWMSWIGLSSFEAAFMMRSHGMTTGEAGVWFGLVYGVSGGIGILLGGYVSARMKVRDERRQVRLSATLMAVQVPCYALFLLLPGKSMAMISMVPVVIMGNFFFGPIFALLQRLVPDNMRAITLAVVMLLANVIGLGGGPQIVGILSDWLAPVFGVDSLRYAMLAMALVALGTAYHFWQAGVSVKSDLARVE